MNIDKLVSRLPYKRFILNGALQAVGQIAGSAISSNAQKKINREMMDFEREESATQRDWNEKMWNAQNDWNLAQWNRENEYNTPDAQIQRLRDAGLNPLYYGLDGSSASALESAQPLGYERASTPNLGNPGAPWQDAALKIAQIANIKAQTDKTKTETAGTELDNEFKEKTMNARTEATELANSLTRKQIKEIDKKMDVMDEDIKLKVAQTDNEIEKKALIQAQKVLAHSQAAEIVYLLPYRQNLLEAQTEAQKAAASASYMHALYEKGLIDGGYIDSLCTEASYNAQAAEYDVETAKHRARQVGHDADIEKFKSSVRNGTLFTGDDWWSRAGNNIYGAMSALSEALGGSLVPLLSAGIIGVGASKAGAKVNVSTGADAATVSKQIAALGN